MCEFESECECVTRSVCLSVCDDRMQAEEIESKETSKEQW